MMKRAAVCQVRASTCSALEMALVEVPTCMLQLLLIRDAIMGLRLSKRALRERHWDGKGRVGR